MQKPTNAATPSLNKTAETSAINQKITTLIARDYSSTMITIVAQYDSGAISDVQFDNLINAIEALINKPDVKKHS